VGGPAGPGQRVRPEGRLDPVPHGAEIDADGGQRIRVEAGEQGSARAQSFQADDFLLDALGCDPMFAQDRRHRQVSSGQGKQEVLAAPVTVPEPEGVRLGVEHDGARAVGKRAGADTH